MLSAKLSIGQAEQGGNPAAPAVADHHVGRNLIAVVLRACWPGQRSLSGRNEPAVPENWREFPPHPAAVSRCRVPGGPGFPWTGELVGAAKKTRTSTAFRPQRPQRCASTSSAMAARPIVQDLLLSGRRGRLAGAAGWRKPVVAKDSRSRHKRKAAAEPRPHSDGFERSGWLPAPALSADLATVGAQLALRASNAQLYRRSSFLAIAARCTSSGPSARRRVRWPA